MYTHARTQPTTPTTRRSEWWYAKCVELGTLEHGHVVVVVVCVCVVFSSSSLQNNERRYRQYRRRHRSRSNRAYNHPTHKTHPPIHLSHIRDRHCRHIDTSTLTSTSLGSIDITSNEEHARTSRRIERLEALALRIIGTDIVRL